MYILILRTQNQNLMTNLKLNKYIWALIIAIIFLFGVFLGYEYFRARQLSEENKILWKLMLANSNQHNSKTEVYYNPNEQSSQLNAYDYAYSRLMHIKHVIENQDGYRMFFDKKKPIRRELDFEMLLKIASNNSKFDANFQVNNGRGPSDAIFSNGSEDKTIVELKLASNPGLKKCLNQIKIYEKANGNCQSILAIMAFTEKQLIRVRKVMEGLNMIEGRSLVLIDASKKKSASV